MCQIIHWPLRKGRIWPNLRRLPVARTPRDPNDSSDSDHVRAKTVVTSISRISERPSGKEACLVLTYGAELGKKYNLHAPALVIARSSKCDIQINHESISRNHTKI